MTVKPAKDQDRHPWLERLNPLRKTPQPTATSTPYPVPPSRKNRKALTTWQDEVALKQLKLIATETGVSQQALIAEGLNYVLTKYGKPAVAT